MKKKKFKFPDFDKMSYKKEAEWWDKHDFTEFWDELKDVDLEVELHKPRDETLVLRLQKSLKEKLEVVARSKGLNISALARMWFAEKLKEVK
ncbi:MAG: CopG family antitoxin [Candidatus Curtissbacteria bacterium]|nr:CopG family antitoxin [Candidatus Curtissbacteria bacterium]